MSPTGFSWKACADGCSHIFSVQDFGAGLDFDIIGWEPDLILSMSADVLQAAFSAWDYGSLGTPCGGCTATGRPNSPTKYVYLTGWGKRASFTAASYSRVVSKMSSLLLMSSRYIRTSSSLWWIRQFLYDECPKSRELFLLYCGHACQQLGVFSMLFSIPLWMGEILHYLILPNP